MIFIIFTFLIFGGWYVWVKIRGTDMVKVKFDYTTKKTSRISTWKIIVAVSFLMLIFILAFTSDSMQTSAGRKVNMVGCCPRSGHVRVCRINLYSQSAG